MESSGQKVTLSICMMVKDEEENLKRCLPSLKGLADEIIVVDTGSSDNTINLVKFAGAKVYEHPWEDDFSKHRNQSLSYATSDWVFIVDADEEVFLNNATSKDVLKLWLSSLPPDCVSAAIVSQDMQNGMKAMQFNSVRLFKRGCVEYNGIVHNTPKIVKGRADAVMCPFIIVKHYGYDLTPEKQAEKRLRTESLLLKRLEINSKDIVAMFYLVQAYTAYDEFDTAVKYIELYSKTSKETNTKFNGSIYCTAAHVYRKLENKEKCREWILAGLKKYPDDLDLMMSLTEYGVWIQDLDLMVTGAKGYLKTYENYKKNSVASGNRFTYANSPEAASYCMFHLSMGMFQQGCNMLDQLEKILKSAHPDYCNGVKTDVVNVLNIFGINKTGWELPNIEQPKVVNLNRIA